MSSSLLGLQSAIRAEALARPDFSRESADTILRYGSYIGSSFEHLEATERLMDHAREQIALYETSGKSYPSGFVYSADQLFSSKGRFQRSWHAPEGGIWIALVLVNTLLPESSTLIPLAAGAACCEAVRCFGVAASVKWVNDVHVQGKKIAGILTECFTGPVFGEEYIIVGIGLNVNNQVFPAELEGTAASMSMFGPGTFDLEAVRRQLLAKLAWNIGLLHYEEERRLRAGDLEQNGATSATHPLIASWRRLSDTLGKHIHFGFNVIEKIHYSAKVIDIDNFGRLVMRLPDGVTITENSGEILYVKE